jgi:hypothetical protein
METYHRVIAVRVRSRSLTQPSPKERALKDFKSLPF